MRASSLLPLVFGLGACGTSVSGGGAGGAGGSGTTDSVAVTSTGTTTTIGSASSSTTGGGEVNPCPLGEAPTGQGGCEPICSTPDANPPDAPWPVYGGCATHRGLGRQNGPESVNVLWSEPISGDPRGGAIVIDGAGRLFVTTSDALTALDTQGNLLWSTPVTGASVPMVAADGHVIVVADGGQSVASFTPDGTLTWSAALPGAAPFVTAATDGRILVVAGTTLTAFSLGGEIDWVWTDPDGLALGPLATAYPDGSTWIMREDGALVLLDATGLLVYISRVLPSDGVTPGAVATVGPEDSVAWAGGDEWNAVGGTLGEYASLETPGLQLQLLSMLTFSSDDGVALSVVGPRGTSQTDFFSFLDAGFVGGWDATLPGSPQGGELLGPDATGYVATTEGLFGFARRAEPLFAFPASGGSICGGVAMGATGVLYVACDGSVHALAP